MSDPLNHLSRIADPSVVGALGLFGVSLVTIGTVVGILAGIGSIICSAIYIYRFLRERKAAE